MFFSLNDFTHEGGGTIRMQGIMNELSKKGHEVIFISNTRKQSLFHEKIRHVAIEFPFSRKDKRIFQGLLGILPLFVIRIVYSKFFNRLKDVLAGQFDKEPIYFFEYLDNSVGYCLKKSGMIQDYINDLHGVATLEFKFQSDHAKSVSEKIKFYLKYLISDLLDRKVFNGAKGLIFASQAMKDYFCGYYPGITAKKNYILPYVLSSDAVSDVVDYELKKQLESKFSILPNEKIIFFAGAFKKTGGITDLIAAFASIVSKHHCRLFLLGDGPTMIECRALTEELGLTDKVVFIGRTPYHYLRTYQDLASVIVCPDKQNVYSELIIHVKYLDALLSGKIVINGSFKSVQEVNVNEFLSVNFTPSSVESLSSALSYSLQNHDLLEEKYKNSRVYAAKALTYASHVAVLEE